MRTVKQLSNNVHSLTVATVEDCIAEPGRCPLPIEVIPNQMGINLCAVDTLTWTRTKGGQLCSLAIKFVPAEEDSNGKAIE